MTVISRIRLIVKETKTFFYIVIYFQKNNTLSYINLFRCYMEVSVIIPTCICIYVCVAVYKRKPIKQLWVWIKKNISNVFARPLWPILMLKGVVSLRRIYIYFFLLGFVTLSSRTNSKNVIVSQELHFVCMLTLEFQMRIYFIIHMYIFLFVFLFPIYNVWLLTILFKMKI